VVCVSEGLQPADALVPAQVVRELAIGAPAPPSPARKAKAGRNEPCPCGSGKKYKKCCLFNQAGV
jgi:uncharacterized protein YecA (UPF0149 family)